MLVVQSILLCYGIDLLEYLKSILDRYLCNGETPDLEEKKIIEIISQQSCACTLDENGLKFWPPLYVQRYMVVQEVIEHPIWNGSIKKVVDFGCSEMGLFKCIKPIPGLNNIMLVDVDYDTLDINQCKVLPTNYDHITMHERKEPLTVDIYNGSIADQDDRMLGVDAVICIELIEHLYLDVLDSLPNNVFEFIKPKLAVFTTPNVEFNILFPNFTTQFRHDDHKFEWTRKQFKEWAKKIIARYPEYAVQFDGIGAGPSGTENIGCCSQMAIFYRKDMTTSPVKPINSTPYKLLRRIDYPHAPEENLGDWPLIDKLRKFVSDAACNKKYVVGDNMKIPLNEIMPYLSDCCSSIDKLEDVARKLYYTTKNDRGEWLLITASSEFGSVEYESDSDSLSNISGQEYNLLENTVNLDDDNEDWNASVVLSSDKSKLCYSTPMTRDPELKYYANNMDSFSTVHSNSDLYKTAVDYNKSKDTDNMEMSSSCNSSIDEDCNVYHGFRTGQNNSVINEEDINETENTLTGDANSHALSNDGDKLNYHCTDDMEISSSYNGSIIVEDCTVYRDFKSGRNNSVTKEEDINETENTLTCVANSYSFSNDDDKLNDNIINDNTIIKNNGNILSLKLKCSSDSARKFKSNNPDETYITTKDGVNEIDNQPTVCLNRTLLDESGYTENLLSTSDNELSKK
ncbi:small RNA 2'-O-methyltransferase isoform X1 [Myzus persicae]|uniref:small RNA 2'-O-methyltransferase isoform X1 n=2 Tax=Myzus persicae TaxID=13164 RepID=UPI000B93198D|nr:small RNA 2'-O-methyltransferase isoform X1 [Myzus persicae]